MTEATTDALALAEAQRVEYGQYVATGDIVYDGVLAFTKGHAVPASHVKQYGYLKDGLVERVQNQSEAKASAVAVSDATKKG